MKLLMEQTTNSDNVTVLWGCSCCYCWL